MKKRIFLATMLTVTVGLASAKGRPAGPPPLDRLAQDLALSVEQETEVREILGAHHEQMQALRLNSVEPGQAQSQREQTDTQLRAVLTEEQFDQFESERAQHRARRPERGGRKPGDDQ